MLAACGSPEPAENNPPKVVEPAQVSVANISEAVPEPAPDLNRERLLLAVAQAASAHAAGIDDTRQQSDLAGRKFNFKIRFGCQQAQQPASEAAMSWSNDASAEALRVRATPDLSKDHPVVQQVFGESFEAIEGFWVPRPWLLQDACPASSPSQPQAPPSPSVGLAQLFTSTESRIQRRAQRSYEIVKKALPQNALQNGVNLVLSGRLSAGDKERVIHCTSTNADERPICLVSVEFDKVSFEDPANKETIAEWGIG